MAVNLSSRAVLCFGTHPELLVLAAFAVVCTHLYALGPRGGFWPSRSIYRYQPISLSSDNDDDTYTTMSHR
jgi:hypothetical protein